MTNETRNRIRAYMEELPHMKEKVFGALLMLVIAATVVVASSYAWVTLSRSPEVSDITTTLAANGALEIALSKPDGTIPDEFDIDESIVRDTNVTISNLQWGNLVNLSDASYGIDNLALRPAQLNDSSLLTSPLWGAVYGSDGRITNLDSSYAYAKYDGKQFLTSNEYGVRAIATYRAEISDSTQQAYNDRVDAAMAAHTKVNQAYGHKTEGVAYQFDALGTMISKYAQDKLDNTNTNLAKYVGNMVPVYETVRDVMDAQKLAYVELANLQSYLYANETGGVFAPLTWEKLYQNRAKYNTKDANTPSTDGNISLVGLSQFITDYENILKDIEYLKQYEANYLENSNARYHWSGTYTDANGASVRDDSVSGYALSNIVAHLIEYSTMTIDLENNGTEVRVTSLSTNDAGALAGANNDKNGRSVYIYGGILYRLEQSSIDQEYRFGGSATIVASCTINVTKIIPFKIYGKAYTKVSGPCSFMENFTKTQGTKLVASDAVAEDTYGLAIDLWVRTNAEQTCLTLEGAVSTDEQGNIVSYDGINRVWGSTGESVLTTDSTTQGGGSCYIYYADTPEDMARSLELLEAMKVVFVDSKGAPLAIAEMDTVNYWAVNGRVTVPLVLDSSKATTTYTYTDKENRTLTGYAITTLYTDMPARVTAIVYLDGTYLTNDHVLAAAEIQGSLNIQFGSSVNLKTIGSNELMDDTRSVTARADKYLLDYDKALTEDDLTATVTLDVEGSQPGNVTAFFVRAINSTQGTREDTMSFEKQDDGTWIYSHKFKAPGTYYLRHVRLDGVDYALSEPLEITVSGFDLSNVTWNLTGDSVTVRTSDNNYSVDIAATFATTDTKKLPVAVQMRFSRDGGSTVNIPLAYNSSTGQWMGTADFSVSGVYTMEYIVYTLKGEKEGRFKDLGGFKKTLDLSLGMYVTVTDLSGGLVEEYEDGKSYPKTIGVKIFNNAGNPLGELTDLKLFYSNGASSTNTINTDLTWEWDELNGCYTGTLPIVSPGRYQFSSVKLGDQYLTLAKEDPPVYTVVSPDAPEYDTNSKNTANSTGDIQLVPLTNDAKIDGLTIEHSEAANVSVVVYSEEAGKYFVRSMSTGDVYRDGTIWTVKLPTYTLDLDEDGNPVAGADYTQEGVWSVAAVMISGCYDQNGVFRSDEAPIVWGGTDAVGRNYLIGADLTADASYDFGALSTNVSSSIKVTMVAGDTALGGPEYAFMHNFCTDELESYVVITDENNNPIPQDKIAEKGVVLKISYTAPSDAKYGYAVTSAANKSYEIPLVYDAGEGRYIIPGTEHWQYVGEYSVTSLSVTVKGATQNVSVPNSMISGVPSMYTVETKGPSIEDVSVTVTDPGNLELGKQVNSTNVIGTFLQSYVLDKIRARVDLLGVTGENCVDTTSLVKSVELVLTYRDGKVAPNGGYSWTDTSAYENIAMPMRNDGNSNYLPGSTPLLSGTYSVKVVATVGDNVITEELPSTVEVYSKTPQLKITGVSPAVTDSFQMNTYFGSELQYYDNAVLTSVQNYFTETLANVYIKATKQTIEGLDSALVDYTLPTVRLTLSDLGTSFTSATAVVPNNPAEAIFRFDPASLTSEEVAIGELGEDSFVYQTSGTCGSNEVDVPYETQRVIGEQTVDFITVTDANGTMYTVSTSAVTIREKSEVPPTISFVAVEGYVTPAGKVSPDGAAFTVTLPTTIGTTTRDYEKTQEGAEWVMEGTPVTEHLTFYKLKSCIQDQPYQAGGTCSSATPAKYTATFIYELYTRTTVVETLTSETQTYHATEGLVKWIINGQEYNPGETITISSVVSATPKIGILSESAIGLPKESTLRRITVTDTYVETREASKQATSSTSNEDAAAVAKSYYNHADCMPAGYSWFDNTTPTKDGHYDTPQVEVLQG